MKQVLEWPSKVPVQVSQPSDIVAETDPLSLHFLGQLNTDPVSPTAQQAWVLATISGGSGGGKLRSFLGAFPYIAPNTGGTSSYQFSFRTLEGSTKRVALT